MNSARDAFLGHVREAVAAGNRAGHAGPLEPRGSAGYQGAGTDPVACFKDTFAAAGGQTHLVSDTETAVSCVLGLVQAAGARKILLGRGNFVDKLALSERLRSEGREVCLTDALPAGQNREILFAADLGISGVDYLIAETGSVVVLTRASEPRSLSLLPPVHIAVAERSQLLPDLFDLFGLSPLPRFGGEGWGVRGKNHPGLGPLTPDPSPRSTGERGEHALPLTFDEAVQQGRTDLPSCLTLITGPSKTGDIEMRLVTGVHGPREIHVVFINR